VKVKGGRYIRHINSYKRFKTLIERMNSEMNIEVNEMSVTTLLLKTLENATREYARGCVTRCASLYGFDSSEALAALSLENLAIQVREMKKRSSGKKTKEPKEKVEKPKKEKVLKEKTVKEKAVKVVAYKPSIPLPFVASMVSEDGCHGLAYNNGLFTQCQKIRMSQSSYCKGCQSEADLNASGAPNNGTVEQRLGCGLMEFRDSKGRSPIAYSKIMDKQHITREKVAEEEGKLNIEIDELHFAVVEKKAIGKPKATKKTVTVVESAPVEDLFAQLVDEDSENESLAATVLLSDSEEEVDTKDQEKAERDMMKEADLESKKAEKAIKNAEKKQQQAEAAALKKQQQAEEAALKKQQQAEEAALKKQQQEAEKAQKKIDDQLAKEAKIAADLLAKEQKKIDELAAKEAKKLQLEQEKAAKEQKLIDDKLAKEKKIADEKAAKEQKKMDELAAKEAKKLQLEQEKAAKEQKLIDEKAAKEAKKLQQEQEKALAQQQKESKKVQQTKAEPKVAAAKPVEEPVAAAAPKKVTVKRITIDGKQYLKTADNLLYDPETKEEMGIYDPETNTIKELPDDDEDEVEEDGYSSE
jgi:hypothetical protein